MTATVAILYAPGTNCHEETAAALERAGLGSEVVVLRDLLLVLHRDRRYVSGAAIAEGGTLLRVFEASLGSGLGACIELTPGVAATAAGQGALTAAKEELLFEQFSHAALVCTVTDAIVPRHVLVELDLVRAGVQSHFLVDQLEYLNSRL